MLKIKNNKKDPDISEMIFLCHIKKRILSHKNHYCWYWCKLYATVNGKYYLVRRENYDKIITEKISEREVKSLLARFRYDIYVKRFGDSEGA